MTSMCRAENRLEHQTKLFINPTRDPSMLIFFQGLDSWVVDRRHCFFMDNKVTEQEPY
jgi:hypothetical protein